MNSLINNIKYFLISSVILTLFIQAGQFEKSIVKKAEENLPISYDSLFHAKLEQKGLSFQAYMLAYAQFEEQKELGNLTNDSLLTVVDFTKSSNEKRFYIIDLKNRELVKHTWVAHGMNSGLEFAQHFSNKPSSHKSSLGAYTTEEVYYGKHGYSLRLNGLEEGINDNARKRAIVIHGANYVSEKFLKENGRLGRSFGCPALSYNENSEIIDLIKNKSFFFIFHNSYLPTLASIQGKEF